MQNLCMRPEIESQQMSATHIHISFQKMVDIVMLVNSISLIIIIIRKIIAKYLKSVKIFFHFFIGLEMKIR